MHQGQPTSPIHQRAAEEDLARLRNPRAGKLWAGLLSLVAGAIANEHEPVAYITDVRLKVRDDMTSDELDALLHDLWTPAR